MDELWSFVDHNGNKPWVWLAMDVRTREVIGCYIGDRSKGAAQALWDSLPSVYRQCAKIYTDHWDAYEVAFRQRISRLVRKTRSFSRKLENHIAAIWNFIHDYNHQIRVRMLKGLSTEFSPSFT